MNFDESIKFGKLSPREKKLMISIGGMFSTKHRKT